MSAELDAKIRAFNAMVRQGTLRYTCPTCGAEKGQPCRNGRGADVAYLHTPRERMYLRKIGAWEP
jgi:hypothetical protein